MTHRSLRRRVRWRVLAVARGLVALVAVLGFVAGVPALMVALGSDPLSPRIPSLERLRTLLTGPDDGTVLVGAAQIVVWCAWAYSTACVLVQTVAALAGRTVPVLRGVAGVRQPVSYLITWITAAVTVPAASTTATAAHAAVHATAAPTPAPDHAAALDLPNGQQTSRLPATAVAAPGPAGAAGLTAIASWTSPEPPGASPAGRTAGRNPASSHLADSYSAGTYSVGPQSQPTVAVRRYDSLWRIAEEHLRDGRRWVEIYRLNTDRAQPDGSRLTDPDTIVEGWTLLLPPDATGITPPPDPTAAAGTNQHEASQHEDDKQGAGRIVVVRPGDTLSGIAEHHLGSADATRALFQANTGRRQPDGRSLTDPDLLRPGWHLTLPGTPPPHTSSPPQRTAPPRPGPAPQTPSQPRPHPPSTPSDPRTAPPAVPPAVPTPRPPGTPPETLPTGDPHRPPVTPPPSTPPPMPPRSPSPPSPSLSPSSSAGPASSPAAGFPSAGSSAAGSPAADSRVPSAPGPGGERADRDPGG